MISSLLDLLFPPLCAVCGDSLVGGEKYICSACLADFPFADDAYGTDGYLPGEGEDVFWPEKWHILFYYNRYSDYRRLIYAVKYRNRKELGVYLGRMLGNAVRGKTDADCIVPVPLHPRRQRRRGYNQARQIALGMAEALGLEVLDGVVVRVRNNVSQTGKNSAERFANTRDIFELRNPDLIAGRHVLLVDDVITTGATLGSCIQTMAAAGSTRFSLACLARAAL